MRKTLFYDFINNRMSLFNNFNISQMKKFFSSIVAVAMAAVSLPAMAAVDVTLVSPAEGDVTNDGNFPTIVLDAGDAVEQVTDLEMVPESGESIQCQIQFSWDSFKYEIDCTGVTKSGKWTLKVPADAFVLEDGSTNEAVEFSWNYTNPVEGQVLPFDFTAYARVNVGDKSVKAAPGEAFESSEAFPNVNIAPEAYGAKVSTKVLRITGDNGYDSEVDINTSFYENQRAQEIVCLVEDLNIIQSGTYTIHIPEGFLTKGTKKSEAKQLTWTYTYKPSQSGGDDKELVIRSLTIAGTDLLTTRKLASLTPGEELAVNIDPIEEAEMVRVNITDDAGNTIRNIEIYEGPTKDDVVDRSTGYYKTSVGGFETEKFFVGTEYTVSVTAYSSTNVGNPANSVWGPVQYKFTGTSEPYVFSKATVVGTTPEDGFDVTDASQRITITYSEPVESVKCEYSSGGQMAVTGTFETIPNADKTIWTVIPGKTFWESSDTAWMFMFYAKDAEGRVVEGNTGKEDGSYYRATFSCYLAWPEPAIKPAAGFVEELYEFTATYPTGVNISWNYVPYLTDAEGNEVCKLDMDLSAFKYFDAEGNPIEGKVEDVKAVKMIFHLTEHVTTPGEYTMVFPRSCFSLGTEFEGEQNRAMYIDYKIVEMPVVNVELENFGKASYKVPQGSSTTVTLAPAEDWKVASVSANGVDVTAEVKDGAYTLKNVTEESSIIATFEYAKEVSIVETTGIVEIGDRKLTVTCTDEYIAINGVAEGDNVAVYTMNGMTIGQMTVTDGKDEIRISAPAGQIYLVKVNGNAFKVKH